MKKLYGIVCANVTPMDETGNIDFESLKNLVDCMAGDGIHGVYPCGTNGEGLLLTAEEHHAVAQTVIEQNRGRMSAFIQCAVLHWADTMENIRFACETGADGVGVMTPTFYKADDAAMIEYYREACLAAGDKPVYLYNIAKYTNNDISPKAYGQIVDQNPNVMGIKYSNSDIARIQDYMRAGSRPSEALIGADSYILSALAAGCVGEVSGPACVFPKWYVGAYESFLAGDHKLALEYQNRIVACSRSIKPVPQIPAIKAMLRMKSVIRTDVCRRPFRRLNAEEYRLLENALKMYESDF
ncbi:MAG: dihydrodipicolinate synthase family protein [Eubacteriales bacterium]|nr:dihydrodipicolinate synthase family protein [Eubacteriales bacterium]